MTAQMHSFAESLRASHRVSDWPGWEGVYRDLFPSLKMMIDFREDGPHQRAGVDRMLVLSTAEIVLVDEKYRGPDKDGQPYRDIFLETKSDAEKGSPGWVCKPLRAHYIAYLNAPLGRCFLLPVVQLQSAWWRYGELWLEEYGERETLNKGWTTLGTPVPVGVLFSAMGSALRVSFEPFDPRFA
jgi:hypothetical protein